MMGLIMGGMLCTLAQEDLMLNDGARPECSKGSGPYIDIKYYLINPSG